MASTRRGTHRLPCRTRNRGPCKACQSAKRKCDQAKPQCSRCRKQDIVCEPSIQARWRVRTLDMSRDSVSSVKSPILSPDLGDTPTTQESASTVPVRPATGQDHNGVSPKGPPPSQDCVLSQADKDVLPDVLDPLNDLDSSSRVASVQDTRLPAGDVWQSSDRDLEGNFPRSFDTFASWLSDLEVSGETAQDIPSMPFYSPALDSWETIDGSWQEPPSTMAEQSHAEPGEIPTTSREIRQHPLDGDGPLINDNSSSSIDGLLATASLPEGDVQDFKAYYSSLWTTFVRQVGPFLTPFGRRTDNPFLKYLVPSAERNSSLLVAVLYLTQVIVRRQQKEAAGPKNVFLEEKAREVLKGLDETGPVSHAGQGSSGVPAGQYSQNLLLTISTVLVFCMAFIGQKDTAKLIPNIEYAGVLCQALFKTHADDEGFLYLAKLLGFIQNTLLFTKNADSVNAPDYLGAAIELQDGIQSCGLGPSRSSAPHAHMRFRDLDMFSGLSSSVASIVYAVGTLSRRQRAGLHGSSRSCHEAARVFESDMDGLEIRLRRHAAVLAGHGEQRGGCTASIPGAGPESISLARDLDSMNEAVFWSCWTIFFDELRCCSGTADPDLVATCERIIDCCAEVPRDSPILPLMLFPLMVGGLKSTKKVYREFVIARLESLDNTGLSDTEALRIDLVEYWRSPKASSNNPISFSNFVF